MMNNEELSDGEMINQKQLCLDTLNVSLQLALQAAFGEERSKQLFKIY